MMTGDFISKYVPNDLIEEFKRQLKKWDNSATWWSFHDKDIFLTALQYAKEV